MESNIQVAVRIRPKNTRETFKSEVLDFDSERIKVIDSDKYLDCSFHRILGPLATQDEVYSFVSPMIHSTSRCISSSILAYGQTGSGKTHTMFGDPSDPGLIFKVFVEVLSSFSVDYTVLFSMVQIYNERIYDMQQDPRSVIPLKLKNDPIFGVYLEGLTEYVIQSPEDSVEIIRRGENNRKVRTTYMSEQSSRSHMVCQITIEGNKPNENGNLSRAKITLCDLAGSERLDRRREINQIEMKEAININKSLTSLGRIIFQLAKKDTKFVPYRDSCLTYLLKDSLEGKSQICIIATVSPTVDTVNETISTLRFANIAKEVALNAKPNQISVADNAMVQRLQKEIKYLKDCMKISKNTEDIHQKLWNLQEENERLKEKIPPMDIEKILKENQKMKIQLQKITEMTGNTFDIVDNESDGIDKFCDRYKSAPSHRNMTPLVNSSNPLNSTKQIEVRIRKNNNSVERRTTTLDKTLADLDLEKTAVHEIAQRNKRIKTLQQIEQFRETKAKLAMEKYEQLKLSENETLRKSETGRENQYSEVNIKKLREIENAKKSAAKAEAEKDKALQDLAKIRQRRDSRSPFRAAATQQLYLPKIT